MKHDIFVVLLLCMHCSIVHGRRKQAAWVAYVDMMTVSCSTTSPQLGLFRLLKWQHSCVKKQQTYLSCSPNDSGVASSEQQLFHSKPCGFISHPYESEQHPAQKMEWEISVHDHFHLNLTFFKFNLSMAHPECRLFQSLEIVLIRNMSKSDPGAGICGHRSPFTLIWTSNRVVIAYRAVPGLTVHGGSFQLQYEVCMPGIEIRHTNIIPNKFMMKTTTESHLSLDRSANRVKVGGLAFYKYDIHLLGSRMRVLDLHLETMLNSNECNLDVYEGPGSAAVHRHPDTDYLLDGEWIYFVTFQAYIQVECSAMEHKFLKFNYIWELASDFATVLEMESELNIPLETPLCSSAYLNNLIYCIYRIQMKHQEQHIQVDFDAIFFDGPHFLGDAAQPHRCFLAGVSVIDGFRVQLNLLQDTFMRGFRGPSKEAVIDSVLPELTTCYDVPFKVSKTPMSHKQPLQFVSVSGVIILVIYAYGAYINLDTSYVSLRGSPTSCAGLTLGCYTIPLSGYLYIARSDYFLADTKLKAKEHVCKGGSILVVQVTSPTEDGLEIEVTWCYLEEKVAIYVVSQLNGRYLTDESCLILNLNPFPTYDRPRLCTLSETDIISDLPHQYATTLRRVNSLGCNTSAKTPPNSLQDGEYTLVAAVNPDCVCVSTKVTLPCAGVNYVPISPVKDDRDVLLTDLTLKKTLKTCANYHISVNASHFFRIYIQQPEPLRAFDEFVKTPSKLDEVNVVCSQL